ncbi:MAG: SMC family ATPase [archaeon]|nr:SMC family ATPase [Nanoarchaeota archaeon]
MYLKRLQLENIRSYQHQVVDFPEGTTLLSGDIGSGKSSILLATEFALFGASRTELSADSLLRKGTNNAYVELNFVLDGNEICIKRTLKRDSNIIKQGNGHIIINQQKRELTPLELKSEIIKLLGYPDDLVTKGKNYVFRYTVYCPQEEMKLILQDSPENRLDILRKIFNIDKYKTVRENLIGYLRKFRKELTVLETRIEPISNLQEKVKILNQDVEELNLQLGKLLPEKGKLIAEITEVNKQLQTEENKSKTIVELGNKLKQNLLLEKELNERKEQWSIKKEKINLQLKELFLGSQLDKDSVKREIVKLETEKTSFLQDKTKLNERIKNCQEKIVYLQNEIKLLHNSPEKIAMLEHRKSEFENLIKVKDDKQVRHEQLVLLNQKTRDLIVKNLTLQKEAHNLRETVISLEQCPTCQQELSLDYKEKISLQEDKKIETSEQILLDLREKESSIKVQQMELLKKLEIIQKAELELKQVNMEIKHLQEQQLKEKDKREELRSLVVINNQLMGKLNSFENDAEINLKRINNRLLQLGELRDKILLKQELEKQLSDLVKDEKESLQKLDLIKHESERLSKELQAYPNRELLEQIILENKQKLESLVIKEKEFSLEETKLKTSQVHLNRELVQVREELDKLIEDKSKLVRKQEIYNWINNYFMRLTYTIEKEILGKIYHHFNMLFQEWFSVLVEDHEISARLDDSFTPIVEQNNYEISFNHLSGGEKTAVSLSYRLALNKVINDVIHEIKTKDLLILDEPTDGFSSEQLDKVRDLIDKLGLGQIIIVSHESKIESFVNNLIRVEKLEHCSQVLG